ncbi:MAG: hypothetical protein GYA17_03305 [Chloroflexi bacterium]|nr:hypothetical protein [Anaerolineaceae bacterium]NMB87360.1 hypothetical protein [Chloroflexota bacterium]
MRITERMMTEHAIRYMSQNQEYLAQLNEKAASTKEFQYASDNPGAASAALTLRSTIQASTAYLNTAETTNDWMQATEDAFSKMADGALRAIKLVTGALNETQDWEDIQDSTGAELSTLVYQAVDQANTTHLGNYIFSGFRINQAPFELVDVDIDEDGDGTPDAVNPESAVVYHGDDGVMKRDLSNGQTIAANINGDQAFRPLIEALIQAREAVENQDWDALSSSLSSLQDASNNMEQYRTTNASRQRQVQVSIDHIEKTQIELKAFLSSKEDANLVEVASLLRNQELTYQAVLEVGDRAISALNLFEILT